MEYTHRRHLFHCYLDYPMILRLLEQYRQSRRRHGNMVEQQWIGT